MDSESPGDTNPLDPVTNQRSESGPDISGIAELDADSKDTSNLSQGSDDDLDMNLMIICLQGNETLRADASTSNPVDTDENAH